ncbi:hypothetical protein D0A38_15010 [Xanthomonas campestris pv. incanae]|nr:hypothetical protein D0A38_15010 [Xanthomonas campestris pv. incanae]
MGLATPGFTQCPSAFGDLTTCRHVEAKAQRALGRVVHALGRCRHSVFRLLGIAVGGQGADIVE